MLMSASWVAKLSTAKKALEMAFLILSAEKGSRFPFLLIMYNSYINKVGSKRLINKLLGSGTDRFRCRRLLFPKAANGLVLSSGRSSGLFPFFQRLPTKKGSDIS